MIDSLAMKIGMFFFFLTFAAVCSGQQVAITTHIGGLGCSTPSGTDTFPVLQYSYDILKKEVQVFKASDDCSARFFAMISTGQVAPSLTLTEYNPGGTRANFVITLQSAQVTEATFAGSIGASVTPSDSLSFVGSSITIQQYHPRAQITSAKLVLPSGPRIPPGGKR